ncbi:hypothetical protein pipiens_018555 [Culex pipiens pipiens]|uniref:Uncharacterized protein n=1 Tax=Culex pipiens pipiens TaxID=38569 RepID=A0ABD1CBB3_CULPP
MLCNLAKEDHVHQFVVKRLLPEKNFKKTLIGGNQFQHFGIMEGRFAGDCHVPPPASDLTQDTISKDML